MQERLDKWRKQSDLPKLIKTASGNSIQHRDFGDSEFDWHQKEIQKNRDYTNRERNLYGR